MLSKHVTHCIRLGCATVALTGLLAFSSGPQAHAADEIIRPPETVDYIDQQPKLPATQTVLLRQGELTLPRTPAPPSESRTGEVVQDAIITSFIGIVVGVTVCALTGGAICAFGM